MIKQSCPRTMRLLLVAATASGALMFAAPQALAQGSGPADSLAVVPPVLDSEEVVVTAPRHYHETGPTGGDIDIVSMSRPVRVDDLDLNTAWGRDELRSRVRLTAASVCGQLLSMDPAGASGNAPCYENTVSSSIHHARFDIRDAYYDPADDF